MLRHPVEGEGTCGLHSEAHTEMLTEEVGIAQTALESPSEVVAAVVGLVSEAVVAATEFEAEIVAVLVLLSREGDAHGQQTEHQ